MLNEDHDVALKYRFGTPPPVHWHHNFHGKFSCVNHMQLVVDHVSVNDSHISAGLHKNDQSPALGETR